MEGDDSNKKNRREKWVKQEDKQTIKPTKKNSKKRNQSKEQKVKERKKSVDLTQEIETIEKMMALDGSESEKDDKEILTEEKEDTTDPNPIMLDIVFQEYREDVDYLTILDTPGSDVPVVAVNSPNPPEK